MFKIKKITALLMLSLCIYSSPFLHAETDNAEQAPEQEEITVETKQDTVEKTASWYARIAQLVGLSKSNILAQPTNRFAVVRIRGEIANAEKIVQPLLDLQEDDTIQALLVIVDSPGGFGGTAELIQSEITRLKEKMPVVALVEDMCCSAAYWSVVSSNHIVAPKASMVGSIGVRWEMERYFPEKYKETNGTSGTVKHYSFMGGEYKGPSDREMTEDEQRFTQEHVDHMYELFYTNVAEARDLNIEEHRIWGNGKIFSGKQADELNLIDSTGGYSDSLDKLKELLEERNVPVGKLVPVVFEHKQEMPCPYFL